MHVGRQIRLRRHRLGLTLESLAHQAGISTNYLSQLETGKRDPKLSMLEAVASALDVSCGELLGSHTDMTPMAQEAASLFDLCSEPDQQAVLQILGGLARQASAKPRSGTRRKATAQSNT